MDVLSPELLAVLNSEEPTQKTAASQTKLSKSPALLGGGSVHRYMMSGITKVAFAIKSQRSLIRIKQHMPPIDWHWPKLGFIPYDGVWEHTPHFQTLFWTPSVKTVRWEFSCYSDRLPFIHDLRLFSCYVQYLLSPNYHMPWGFYFPALFGILCFSHLHDHLIIINLYNPLDLGKFSSMILSMSKDLLYWPKILLLHLYQYVGLVFFMMDYSPCTLLSWICLIHLFSLSGYTLSSSSDSLSSVYW